MAKYIPLDALLAEIEKLRKIQPIDEFQPKEQNKIDWLAGKEFAITILQLFLDTLEVKEVDLEKLGEIARHLIAVKEHIEDMRLDKEEWFMLEKIGYPERFKTQKGEEV